VASFALTSVAVITTAVLAVIEATLLEIAELGFSSDCLFGQLGQVRAIGVLEVLELDLRVRDKDTARASRKPVVLGLHFVDKLCAVHPNYNLTIGPGQHRDYVERVLLVLPGMLCHAVLFAVLADDQVGTNFACATALNAALRVLVVDVLDGVVEADEVVLVLETEHHSRVVVVAVFDGNGELVVHFVVHEVLVDEPASARVASTLVPVGAPVGPVASNAFAAVTTIARAGLAVLEGALGEIFELGDHRLSRHL